MGIILNDENPKKRKKDDKDDMEWTPCTPNYSPKKTFKSIHLRDGEPSSQLSRNSESQASGSDESQELSGNSVASVQHGASAQQSSTAVFKLPQVEGTLKLDRNHVFTRLLVSFSQENLPDKITYDGKGYTLTDAYDEFWKTFFSLPYYSVGHGIKLPRVQTLIDLELRPIVKILKRGWEDERYWPKELSRPFLESCLFGEVNSNSIAPEVFLEFIELSDKALVQSQVQVNQCVVDVFRKYWQGTLSIGDDIKDSCIKAAHEIMVINMKPVIDIWREELTGLMPLSTFEFLMGPNPDATFNVADSSNTGWQLREKDLEGHSAPHKLWKTFFLGWPEDKVKYYFKLLANNTMINTACIFCGDTYVNAKHFLCKCDNLLETLRLDRHDAILKILLNKVALAVHRNAPFFSKGTGWKVLTSYKNEPYRWPEEMSNLRNLFPRKYPHVIVYSLSPEKKALIIEHSISWEYWMERQTDRKTEYYSIIKEELEKVGFKVEYRVFTLGSRGVFIPDLYDLFEQIFGMKHSEASKTMEEISQEILDVPYRSDYYKKLMENAPNPPLF